ncbi:MAG: hypothetical protein ACRDRL_09365, partial [Sciscionella sp.]
APAGTPHRQPLTLRSGDLARTALRALGRSEVAAAGGQAQLRGCLRANRVSSMRAVAGVAGATLDGKPATVVLLSTGKAGQFRLLVLGKGCASGQPHTLTDSLIGSGLPVAPTH